jgi:hypothetical protein
MADVLNCRFNQEGSGISTTLGPPVTVGSEISLLCDGTIQHFDAAKLKAEALNQPEYSIHLLRAESRDGTTLLTLTSYRVGEFKDAQIVLTDGTQIVKTNPLSWTVKSVIDPKNPQAAQPFGPFGPWKMAWPWWYFLILALVLVAAIGASVKTWRVSRRRLEVRRRIGEYRQKFNPFDQFQKTLRRLDRSVAGTPAAGLVEELRSASLTYLMMEFEIDVEGRSPRWIVRRLKKRARKARDGALNDLALFLNEFRKGEGSADIEKMIDWAGRLSEKISREGLGIPS